MHLYANKQTGNDAYAFIQAWGELSLLSLQKFAELQFTFVATQMESVYDQVKLLSNAKIFDHFMAAETGLSGAYGSKTADITRKATTMLAVSGNGPVPQIAKRNTNVTAPKTKPAARRKIRKKDS